MSHSQPFSTNYNYYHHEKADDSSTVFDADTVMPDEVPSFSLTPPMPPLPIATATTTDYHQQQPNNINETISSIPHSSQEESPANTISELLRRINSRHRPTEASTTTAAATATGYDANTVIPYQEESPATAVRSEEISTNISLSSSSKKRSIITNSSSRSPRKKTRQSSRLKRQQDQSYVDKSDSDVEDYEPDEAVINQSSSSSSQTSTTKRQRQNELKWRSKFEELQRSNRNVNAPQSNKELGRWASHQRAEYRKFKKNGKGKITRERIDMLESIGFDWVAPNQGGQRNEPAWNKRFNELKEYKEKYKDTNVSRYSKDNKQLGDWVITQRREYKKFQANKKTAMTDERIEMLESIGFEWVLNRRNESKWNERFTELKEYKEKNGRTNVPQNFKENKELGKWVDRQRTEYKKLKENKHSCMTPERIEMLNSIGFQWELHSEWNKRFNELKAYKELHGHTNVSRYSKDNKQLGAWVSTQRAQYKKFEENKKSSMTDERINMLNSIGFQWECRPARATRS